MKNEIEIINKIKLHELYISSSGKEGRLANFSNMDLSFFDFSGINLDNANLENANLSNANLDNANLCNSNLENANLSNADLENTNLCNSNLKNANLFNTVLENANLYNVIGNCKEVKTFQFPKYNVVFYKDVIQIGCENHTKDEWLSFSDKEINDMDIYSLEWWNKYKELVIQLYENVSDEID